MGRSVRLVAALVTLMSPLFACSLLVGTSGLGDGSTTSTAADATTGTADARTSDDATTATDAPVDAGDAAARCVDGPSRFCDDFDSPLPGSKWTSINKKRGAVTFDDAGLSPPRAMHGSVLAGSGGAEAQLIKTLPGNPATVHCELDMKLDAVSAVGETDALTFITQVGGVDRHSVYFATFSGAWSLAEYADGPDGGASVDRMVALGAPLPDATWFHVAIDVSPTAAALAANGSFIKLDSLSTPAGNAHLVQVGITFTTNNVDTGGVYVDNVDCSWLP
jgi:hypothetical protein